MSTEFPSSARNPIEALTEQFLQRRRAGESPTIEEYAENYPELASEIRDVFPALLLMENVRADVAADSTCDTDLAEPTSHVGETIGDYRILREIGRGGMGIVYEADQESLGRRVALKVLSPELVRSPRYLQRFGREARAAANLQHSNIVPVFGVGEDDGVHYYVMQHIHGRSIDEVMDALNRLPNKVLASPHEASATDLAEVLETGRIAEPRERTDRQGDPIHDTEKPSSASTWRSSSSGKSYFQRVAELGSQAADALAYAHRRGVLHRDIKPSNLLLDLTGNVWITDFGLAKVEGDHDITATGDVVGTLRYIAPEALRGEFDARGDIYGLGLTLYEMVARQRAFDSTDRGELVRRISSEGPPRLSRQSVIPRDLETIICKAIERDPKDRYSSAHALADDLNRFLRYEPVLARRISAPARLARWSRRNRALAAVSILLLSGLVIALVASLFVSNRLLRLTDELSTSLHDSRQLNYVGDVGLAYQAIRNGDVARGQNLLLNHVPEPGKDEDDLRGFEWRYLWSRTQGNYSSDLGTYHGFLSGLAVSPDGQFLARYKPKPPRVEIIRVASSEVEHAIDAPSGAATLVYTSNGAMLIGSFYGKLIAWDTRTWEPRGTADLHSPIAVGRRNGKDILVGYDEDDGGLVMWDVSDWQKVAELPRRPSVGPLLHGYGGHTHTFSCLAISGDGKFLFFAGAAGIRRWDLDRRVELEPFPIAGWRHFSDTSRVEGGEGASSVATSSDGQLAVGDRRGNVRLIDPRTGQILHKFESHIGWVSALKFAADGTRLVSAGGDRNVVLYDPTQRTIVDRLLGHSTQVWGLDISAGSETIAAGSGYRGHLLTWSAAEDDPEAIERAGIREYSVMADSRLLVLRDGKNDAEFYDPQTATYERMGASRLLGMMIKGSEKPIAVSPDAMWCVTWKGKTLTLWNVKTEERVRTLTRESIPVNPRVNWYAVFSPNSQFLLISGQAAVVRLWRTEDWTSVELCPPQSRAWGVGFSADSRRLVVGEHRDFVRVFDLNGTKPRPLLQLDSKNFSGHSQCIFSAALSSDGRYVAVGPADGVTRVWDLDTSEMVAFLEGQIAGVASLSFSPDDRTLASCSHSGNMKLWHVPTWRQLMNVPAEVDDLHFSPDGSYLAAIVRDGDPEDFPGDGPGLRIWKTPTLKEIDIARE